MTNKPTHYYYQIIGDHKSRRITLSREEAFEIINTYSKDLYQARLDGTLETPSNQRKTATLLSVSFYCGGGWEPYTRTKVSKSKVAFPMFTLDEYTYAYTRNFLTQLKTYNPSKGNFGSYLKFVKQHAVRDVFNFLKKKDMEKEMMAILENAMAIRFGTKTVGGNTYYRDEHCDNITVSEDFYSFDEELDDIGSEAEETEDCVGGCLEADDS